MPGFSFYGTIMLVFMNTKNILAFLVVVALVAGGFVLSKKNSDKSLDQVLCTMEVKMCPDGSYVGRTGPKCQFAQCGNTGNVALKKYTNAKLKFFISYPNDFTLNENYVYTAMGPGKDIHGISFAIPESMSKGTNLSSDSYVSVESLNKKTCTLPDFIDNIESVKIITEDGETSQVASNKEGGAGNFYEQSVFSLNNCHVIRYFIHSTNIGNYDSSTVREFDHSALIKVFDTMRKSYSKIEPM